MCADCDFKEWGVMPYSQHPKLIRCQTMYVLLKLFFLQARCAPQCLGIKVKKLKKKKSQVHEKRSLLWNSYLQSRPYVTVYIEVLPTNLPQNHMDSLVRIQTQASTPDLRNQSLWEQSLGICIFNRPSRRFFYRLIHENHCIYLAIFGVGLAYYCCYCFSSDEKPSIHSFSKHF